MPVAVAGQVITAGDWNAHLSREHGNRGWGNTTRNGKCRASTMKRWSLFSIDMSRIGQRSKYTFHKSRGQTSYIDHIKASASLKEGILTCKVMEDEVANTSDHLAIQLTMSCPGEIATSGTSRNTGDKTMPIAWNKLCLREIETHYRDELEKHVCEYKS